jgi:uracil-DNA glycosylase
MRETLAGWPDDLEPAWQDALGGVTLGFADIAPDLRLEPWEPIFPARKGRVFPGAPAGAHMLRAFEGIGPDDVRCVILGQDPYPCPAFATGRAFEAGNVSAWRELEKMFSHSVRTLLQLIGAARSGDPAYARSTADWPRLIDDIEAGRLALPRPGEIAGRWVGEGVLLLNASLTLSRFRVEGDPHQLSGHLPLWRPLVMRVIELLAGRADRPVVFICFGASAARLLAAAGLAPAEDRPMEGRPGVGCIVREHPAAGDAMLSRPNPFVACNRLLAAMNAAPIAW